MVVDSSLLFIRQGVKGGKYWLFEVNESEACSLYQRRYFYLQWAILHAKQTHLHQPV